MAEARFDVVGMGNAMVDIIAQADDALLGAEGLAKGAMTLIEAERVEQLYATMPPGVEVSGGSAANTTVGVASLGGRAAFIGKVADDQFGTIFRHDIRAAGVTFESSPGDGAPTGRCLIFFTPDAQRTMQTYLGAGEGLGPEDIDAGVIASAHITYLEGYLWDPALAKEAFLKATRIAHEAGRKVSLTLSDPFCVDRHRESFVDLVTHHVDVLFANEQEIISLYEVRSFDEALQRVRGQCEVAALTRSAKGSVLVSGDEVHIIDAEPAHVVDTTGAGDMYAAGVLYGLTQGLGLPACGRIGSIAAAEVISHIGARPETPLRTLIREKMAIG
ncbi:MAG: adenosine kinase [Dehalococcoidia bacterium]